MELRDCMVSMFSCVHFCLRPSAKDQEIIQAVVVVVVVLSHLSHFLFKRNLGEQIYSLLGIKPGSFCVPVKHSINLAMATLTQELWKIIYLT